MMFFQVSIKWVKLLGSYKARKPEGLDAKRDSLHQAFKLPGIPAFQLV
jgi:hypothetical protein